MPIWLHEGVRTSNVQHCPHWLPLIALATTFQVGDNWGSLSLRHSLRYFTHLVL